MIDRSIMIFIAFSIVLMISACQNKPGLTDSVTSISSSIADSSSSASSISSQQVTINSGDLMLFFKISTGSSTTYPGYDVVVHSQAYSFLRYLLMQSVLTQFTYYTADSWAPGYDEELSVITGLSSNILILASGSNPANSSGSWSFNTYNPVTLMSGNFPTVNDSMDFSKGFVLIGNFLYYSEYYWWNPLKLKNEGGYLSYMDISSGVITHSTNLWWSQKGPILQSGGNLYTANVVSNILLLQQLDPSSCNSISNLITEDESVYPNNKSWFFGMNNSYLFVLRCDSNNLLELRRYDLLGNKKTVYSTNNAFAPWRLSVNQNDVVIWDQTGDILVYGDLSGTVTNLSYLNVFSPMECVNICRAP